MLVVSALVRVGRALLEERGGAITCVNVLHTRAHVAREGIRGPHGALRHAICLHGMFVVLAKLLCRHSGAVDITAHVAANALRRVPHKGAVLAHRLVTPSPFLFSSHPSHLAQRTIPGPHSWHQLQPQRSQNMAAAPFLLVQSGTYLPWCPVLVPPVLHSHLSQPGLVSEPSQHR